MVLQCIIYMMKRKRIIHHQYHRFVSSKLIVLWISMYSNCWVYDISNSLNFCFACYNTCTLNLWLDSNFFVPLTVYSRISCVGQSLKRVSDSKEFKPVRTILTWNFIVPSSFIPFCFEPTYQFKNMKFSK